MESQHARRAKDLIKQFIASGEGNAHPSFSSKESCEQSVLTQPKSHFLLDDDDVYEGEGRASHNGGAGAEEEENVGLQRPGGVLPGSAFAWDTSEFTLAPDGGGGGGGCTRCITAAP